MKNRPLFYLFAGVVLGEECYCINKIMAGAVAAFCLILYFYQRNGCDFLLCKSIRKTNQKKLLSRIFKSFFIGFILGICFVVAADPIPESGDMLEGEIRGTIAEIGAGKTKVIRLSPFAVKGKPMSGSLLLYGETENLLPGQSVMVNTKIQPYELPCNPGQFDLKQYYRCRGIYYYGFFEEMTVIEQTPDRYRSKLFALKKNCIARIRMHLSDKDSGVLCAVLLGEKSYLDSDLEELYQKNGIAHILAISGLHISMLGGTIYHFFKRIGISFLPSGLLSFVVMIPYCIMIGNAVSALRAVIMLMVWIGADIKGRGYDFLSSASLAGVLILGENPYYLFDAGFLLSFGAVFAIGCISPCFVNWKRGKQLWTGLSIWLVLLPIQLWFFFEVSPGSILLNLFVVPVMPLLLFFGIAGICTNFGLFFIFCHIILQFYERISIFPSLVFGKPKWFLLILYFVLFVIACYLLRKEKRIMAVLCLIVAVSSICLFHSHGFLIAFLDVGQGDCIVISSPSGKHYMIDGGSSDVSEVGKYRILPYLKSQAIHSLDYVIITHFDEDHYSGIEEIIGSYPIHHLLIFQNIGTKKEEGYQRIAQLAEQAGIEIHACSRGSQLKDEELSLICQFPEENYQAEKNQQSLVFLLRYHNFRCLLTGDLELEGEEEFVKMDLTGVEVLKVGHHGSKNATSESLLQKINPSLAIISCGKNNRYGHPHADTLKRLEEIGCQIKITANEGAVWIEEVHDRFLINTMSGK